MIRLFRHIAFAVALMAVLVLSACQSGHSSASVAEGDTLHMRHARLLNMIERDGVTFVEVANPWKPGQILHRYMLVPRSMEQPDSLPLSTVVRMPIERATVFTSIHCAVLEELGALSAIQGVCDLSYINLPSVHRAVESGQIADMGSALNPNVERILACRSDALLLSPFENAGYGALERTGLPLIECADYMETSALARAEWIRFYGRLVGRAAEADSIFNAVESHYQAIADSVASSPVRPTLFCDLMNGAAWFQPGATSTMGRICSDAGARYLFSEYEQSGSLRLAFESVYAAAHNADVWIIKYGRSADHTYASLLQEKADYARFKAYRTRRVYGCNTFRTAFYDETPFHPERLLKDLAALIHPELFPSYTQRYYHPLKP